MPDEVRPLQQGGQLIGYETELRLDDDDVTWTPVRVEFMMEPHPTNEANERAVELLLEHLTDAQQHWYRRYGWVDVKAQGGNVYRTWGTETRVVGGPLKGAAMCIQAPRYPWPDVVLARKLMLETDEVRFLCIAEVTHVDWKAVGCYIERLYRLGQIPESTLPLVERHFPYAKLGRRSWPSAPTRWMTAYDHRYIGRR